MIHQETKEHLFIFKGAPYNLLGYKTMKKIVFVFAVMIAMVTSVTMFANSNKDGYCVRNHDVIAINVAVQGPRCSGTVGCGCPGFSPITNGDV